jgi:hypothetical protein
VGLNGWIGLDRIWIGYVRDSQETKPPQWPFQKGVPTIYKVYVCLCKGYVRGTPPNIYIYSFMALCGTVPLD